MSKHLEKGPSVPSIPRIRRRPKGWTPERRVRQAALIRRWQPWRHSTGPKTEAGRARAAQNAHRHGFRSRDYLVMAARIRCALRLAAANVARVRARFGIDLRWNARKIALSVPPELRCNMRSPKSQGSRTWRKR